jgi:hypothetical protein
VNKEKETIECQHPKHNQYLELFLKKYPTANKDARFVINMVDPEEWNISDDIKKNTVSCCIMCSIQEDITRTTYRNISTSGYGTMDKQI